MKRLTILLTLGLLISACSKEEHRPMFSSQRPSPITDYSVENIPGGAEITCDFPDNITLYAKAVYSTKEGLTREAKTSKYNNVLTVDGFPESDEYRVMIFAVSGDEQESAPTEITIHPKTPPYKQVLNDLEFTASYGGGVVTSVNESLADLVVGVVTKNDTTGEWEDVTQEYTRNKQVNFALRGYPPEEREFGFYTRDQWLNYSDTIYKTITPWEEISIDFSNFVYEYFPGDAPDNGVRPTKNIFDGVRGNWQDGFYSDYMDLPQTITIKLPGTYQLSRFKLWQSMENPYGSSNPKHIKIWGSVDPPVSESYDEWYLLGEFDNWKPSGLPVDENSDEDMKQGNEGNEFSFPLDTREANYIRFQTVETWEPRDRVYITELAFWGREL